MILDGGCQICWLFNNAAHAWISCKAHRWLQAKLRIQTTAHSDANSSPAAEPSGLPMTKWCKHESRANTMPHRKATTAPFRGTVWRGKETEAKMVFPSDRLRRQIKAADGRFPIDCRKHGGEVHYPTIIIAILINKKVKSFLQIWMLVIYYSGR